MWRSLSVRVDRGTWPAPPGPPVFPASFQAGASEVPVHIPALLLLIGYLTTPSHASGTSLSEYWAWVRYLSAIAERPDLRLTSAFYELDAHQKTILSDDFGMGIPVYWLVERLQLNGIADGRYFIDRVAATVGAVAPNTGKRGPRKSPDFVALDLSGDWHVIECKGTQSGLEYRERQLGDPAKPDKGAVAQKRSIIFPAGHTGQKLACGLAIGVEGKGTGSSLKIIDPEGDDPFAVEESQMLLAVDALQRGSEAKALRLAGFPAAASAVSAPGGPFPSSRPSTGRRERARATIVASKERSARQELRRTAGRDHFQSDGERFRGREVLLDLPVILDVGGRMVRRVRVRHGASTTVLDALSESPFGASQLDPVLSKSDTEDGRTRMVPDDLNAKLWVGRSFVSEIELIE